MGKNSKYLWFIVLFLFMAGCTQHKIDSRHEISMAPVEIKPIHITIDVNVKIDKALDDFFDELDEYEKTIENSETLE